MTTTIDMQTGQIVNDPAVTSGYADYYSTLSEKDKKIVDERQAEKLARAEGKTLNGWLDWNYDPDNWWGWSRSNYVAANLLIAATALGVGYGIYRQFR